jgi:hypothetical protein
MPKTLQNKQGNRRWKQPLCASGAPSWTIEVQTSVSFSRLRAGYIRKHTRGLFNLQNIAQTWLPIYRSFLIEGVTGIWTQGLALTRQALYYLSHSANWFCNGYFCIKPRPAGPVILRSVLPHVVGLPGLHPFAPPLVVRGPANFTSIPASNYDSSSLCLPRIRLEPLCAAIWIFKFLLKVFHINFVIYPLIYLWLFEYKYDVLNFLLSLQGFGTPQNISL